MVLPTGKVNGKKEIFTGRTSPRGKIDVRGELALIRNQESTSSRKGGLSVT